jgi:hypothetical protein
LNLFKVVKWKSCFILLCGIFVLLFCSFRGVALTNCVTDRTKTIRLPTKVEET